MQGYPTVKFTKPHLLKVLLVILITPIALVAIYIIYILPTSKNIESITPEIKKAIVATRGAYATQEASHPSFADRRKRTEDLMHKMGYIGYPRVFESFRLETPLSAREHATGFIVTDTFTTFRKKLEISSGLQFRDEGLSGASSDDQNVLSSATVSTFLGVLTYELSGPPLNSGIRLVQFPINTSPYLSVYFFEMSKVPNSYRINGIPIKSNLIVIVWRN